MRSVVITGVGCVTPIGTGADQLWAGLRARRSAVLGLLAVLLIPLVHFSVELWRSLHQEASVANPSGDVTMTPPPSSGS